MITGWIPVKYRCLRRVNGRIEAMLWTVESPDADDITLPVENKRLRSLDDVEAGLEEGSMEPLADWIDHTVP